MEKRKISALIDKEEQEIMMLLGQKLAPFIEETSTFINDIKPLLDEINVSIRENMKNMPQATEQLSKVTEANEIATTKIMNILDGVMSEADSLVANINHINKICIKTRTFPQIVLDILKSGKTLEQATELITIELEKYNNYLSEYDGIFIRDNEIANNIMTASTQIMMALQVQDISSQQIAAVSFLMQNVTTRLSAFIANFDRLGFNEITSSEADRMSKNDSNVVRLHRDIAFDPDAVHTMVENATQQIEIDSLIESYKQETEDNE